MDLNQLADIGEFLGGTAVLVTLIYLAVQVSGSKRALKAQAHHDALAMCQRPFELLIADAQNSLLSWIGDTKVLKHSALRSGSVTATTSSYCSMAGSISTTSTNPGRSRRNCGAEGIRTSLASPLQRRASANSGRIRTGVSPSRFIRMWKQRSRAVLDDCACVCAIAVSESGGRDVLIAGYSWLSNWNEAALQQC